MPRRRTLRAPIAVLVACGACATAPPLPAPGVLEAARSASSYSARLRVSLKGPGLRARTPALVAFERPGALRLEIPGPSGARLVAVARGQSLVAAFPGDRAVFVGAATAEDLAGLLGVALTPAEIMDLLVGAGAGSLRSYRVRWGASLPREIEAVLPDGARLSAVVEEAEAGAALPPLAFQDPPHTGYRVVGAEEARGLWGRR